MNAMSNDEQLALIGAKGMAVGEIEHVLSQGTYRHKVRCPDPDTAKDVMYQARRVGVDAFVRGASLFLLVPAYQIGLLDKIEILARAS